MHRKDFNWALSLSRLGVNSAHEDEIGRRIISSNVVFISLPIVYFVFMVIDYESYLIPVYKLHFDQFVVPIVIAICFFCLWLNHQGRTSISRVLFIACWPFLLQFIPIYLLQTPGDYYLAYPFGIVFHSVLIQLMFSYTKEWPLYIGFMGFNLLAILFMPALLIYFDTDDIVLPKLVTDKYYLYDGILYWLLFNLLIFYILNVEEDYIKKITNAKKLIEEQKEELNALNQSLEELISNRTSKLEEQNSKLKQHAFFNAHLLRGPFCRIQGLLQVQDMINGEDNEEIKIKLGESIQELDARIREIQRLVEIDEKEVQ